MRAYALTMCQSGMVGEVAILSGPVISGKVLSRVRRVHLSVSRPMVGRRQR